MTSGDWPCDKKSAAVHAADDSAEEAPAPRTPHIAKAPRVSSPVPKWLCRFVI